MKILSIKGREILDSRGKSTVAVELGTSLGKFSASVPSGTSKGCGEAFELPAKKAVQSLNQVIAKALSGRKIKTHKEIDRLLINLDGSKNKKNLGANAILALSIAASRATAKEKRMPLWKYISQSARIKPKLPKPSVLLIEGGLHGKTILDIQEFMVVPQGRSFREKFFRGKKIYHNLKKILQTTLGQKAASMGLEGAFTPPLSDTRQVLDLIMEASKGYNIEIGLDCAASNIKKGKYDVAFYQKLVGDYPILFLEDPFGEEEWEKWQLINSNNQNPKLLIVGDDLTVTNSTRVKLARKKKACNAIIIKPNQIGTVSEAIEAVKLANSYGWKIIVSHRSGETRDDFIADFATGVGADLIKTGAPSKPERMAKYNRLLQIENKEFAIWQN